MIAFTLRQLGYFVAAAEHGSVARAARAVHVSQPSISAAVAKLEDRLGVQVFFRHPAHGVALTPAGVQVLTRARGLLEQARAMEEDVAGLASEVRGEIRVGCFATFAPLFMPSLMAGFVQRHSEAAVRVEEGTQDQLLEGLRTARFEAALLYDVALGADLDLTVLGASPPYVLLPAAHRLGRRRSVSLRDVASEPMVLLDVPPSREYFLSLFVGLGLQPRVRYYSPSFEMVRGVVGNGAGFSVLVTRPATDLAYDGTPVVCRPVRERVPEGRIVLARLPQARPTRLTEAFAQHCREYFGTL